MNLSLRHSAEQIARRAIDSVKPDEAVRRALFNVEFHGRVFLVAAGKAAWQMASAALSCLSVPLAGGVVITKYHHVLHPLEGLACYEAGHPIPDENSFLATQAALDLTQDLLPSDTVLFLLSGGGSALFEKPLIAPHELQNITQQLLASGAAIVEMNTIRKRLSAVKGGRFAQWCSPAAVHSIILSDVLGDPLDMIASGPAAADPSTCAQAQAIVKQYGISLSPEAARCLSEETPKELNNVTAQVIGSVRQLCAHAAEACKELGYEPVYLTDRLCCQAKEAGSFLSSILKSHANDGRRIAWLAGGETVVHLTGTGLGGRNQELALAAAEGIAGIRHAAVISVGSDGTDGPTDAAGGYVDGDTLTALQENGLSPFEALAANDAYHALQQVDGLIFTGPTGTNVNDISIALLDLPESPFQ